MRRERIDPDLERLIMAAKAGRQGMDLTKLSDEEVVNHLSIGGDGRKK